LLSITKEEKGKQGITQQSPLYPFMYALKSSEARRQYPKRLKMLFDYIRLPGLLEEQAREFLDRASEKNIQSAQDSIMNFLDFHKESDVKNLQQVLLKTITGLPNYFVK
jgi:hypothetical protein